MIIFSLITYVTILEENAAVVDIDLRLDGLKLKGKPPLIYHAFNVSNDDATINVQIKPMKNTSVVHNTRLFIMLRKEKLPIVSSCDLVKSVSNISNMNGI